MSNEYDSEGFTKVGVIAVDLKGDKDPDDHGTAIGSLKIENRHILTEEDKDRSVSSEYANTIFNETTLIKSKDQGVKCDVIIEKKVCGTWRLSGVGKRRQSKRKRVYSYPAILKVHRQKPKNETKNE